MTKHKKLCFNEQMRKTNLTKFYLLYWRELMKSFVIIRLTKVVQWKYWNAYTNTNLYNIEYFPKLKYYVVTILIFILHIFPKVKIFHSNTFYIIF